MECQFRLIAWASLSQERKDRGDWFDTSCCQSNCPLWNERFGKCSLAVDAHLKGEEDRLLEQEMIRKGG
jgi:hypothetical protein